MCPFDHTPVDNTTSLVDDVDKSLTAVSLPPELLEDILLEAWHSVESPSKRKSFVTSVASVSRLWWSTLSRILFQDVYITCPDHLQHFQDALQNQGRQCRERTTTPLSSLCRSFSMYILPQRHYNRRHLLCSERRRDTEYLKGRAISQWLDLAYTLPYTENLRDVSFTFPDVNSDVNTTHLTQIHFQAIHLHVTYICPPNTPSLFIGALCDDSTAARIRSRRQHAASPWTPPPIYHVSVGSIAAVGDILTLCSNMELDEDQVKRPISVVLNHPIPNNRVIVYGPFAFPVRPYVNPTGSIIVQGKILGLIVDLGRNLNCDEREPGLSSNQIVHFLRRRTRN